MRWKGRRQSTNIEDRRGMGGLGGIFGGGVRTGRRRRGGRGLSGGALILVVIAALVFGKDLNGILSLLVGGSQMGSQTSQPYESAPSRQTSAADDELAQFVRVILAETEDTWAQVFSSSGQRYRPATLVMYTGKTTSACGVGSASTGPFYCPADQKIYIDLSFLNEMRRMGASGDFAFAYVIAHEVGHHVQNLVGIANDVRRRQQGVSRAQSNALQVKMELQADCLAGVWANHTENRNAILEQGDIQEGMNAAAAVGDDRISRGMLDRESYTHGSSKERMFWFNRGLQSGDINSCNTFDSGF